MKEEGEITDDDDDRQFVNSAKVQRRQTDRDNRSTSVKNAVPRFSAKSESSTPSVMEMPLPPASKSDLKAVVSGGRSASAQASDASVVQLLEVPLPAAKEIHPDSMTSTVSFVKFKPNLATDVGPPCKIKPDLRTSTRLFMPPATSHSALPPQKWRERFRLNPNRPTPGTSAFTDGKGTEVITIDDSSTDSSDGEIVDVDDEDLSDLDVLQLRREALDSAFRANRRSSSFGDDVGSLPQSEFPSVSSPWDLAVDHANADADMSKVGHADLVTTAGSQSEDDDDRLACGRPCFSEDFVLTSDCNHLSTAASLLNIKFRSHHSAESDTVEADTQKHRDVKVHSHLQPELGHGVPVSARSSQSDYNRKEAVKPVVAGFMTSFSPFSAAGSQSDYEEVEMELDSGSDCEKPEVASCPPSEMISISSDRILFQNHSLAFPEVSEWSASEAHISIADSNMLNVQKVPSDKLTVLSEETGISETNGSSLLEPAMLKPILQHSNTGLRDNFYTKPSMSPVRFELSTTDSFLPQMSGYNLPDNAFTQSAVPSAAGISNGRIPALMDEKIEPLDSTHLHDLTPALMDIKLEPSDASSSRSSLPALLDIKTEPSDAFKQQQQRKATKGDDKKSELLLRAEVLKSLSSKRQLQQSLQLDVLSGTTRETTKAVRNAGKLQVGVQSSKRTVTPSVGNQLTVKLPVQPQLIIPVESSDSDEHEQLDMTDYLDRTSVPVLAGKRNEFASIQDRYIQPLSLGQISRSTSVSSLVELPQNVTNLGPGNRPHLQQLSTTGSTHLMSSSSSTLDRFLREMREATEKPGAQQNSAVDHGAEAVSEEKHITPKPVHSSSTSSLKLSSTNSWTSLAKNLVAESSMRTQVSASMGRKDRLQRLAVCSLEKEIASERHKLQQQKVGLSKVKLKVARKEEQVGAAEKRIKKLREQLTAAERIAASSKKQLSNLHEETLGLSRGIEQRQTAIDKLETRLQVARRNLSRNVTASKSLETVSSGLQLSDSRVVHKRPISDVDATNLYAASSSAVNRKDIVSCKTSADVTGPSISRVVISDNGANLTVVKPVNAKANMSPRPKKCRRISAMGTYRSGGEMELVVGKTELASRDRCSMAEALEQSACDTVNSSQSLVDIVSRPDVLAEQKVSSDKLSAVASEIESCQNIDQLTMPSDNKLKQILHHYSNSLVKHSSTDSLTPYSHFYVCDPLFCFRLPLNTSSTATSRFLVADTRLAVGEIGDHFRPYRSGLLCFRSYRLGHFFRENCVDVCSETFCHKLDCQVPLCRFDLMGKCLDDSCRLQHRSDYSLSSREQLLDIVSYSPSLAGIDSSTPRSMYGSLFNQFIDKFVRETDAHLEQLEQCHCIIDCIEKASVLKHPHAVRMSARSWKLTASRQFSREHSDFMFSSGDVSETCVRELVIDDVRYWMALDSDQITHLEEAVAQTPTDADLWFKLAAAKMMEKKWMTSHDECVSYGLNVLSRAVEANPSNSRLWTHYLDLYMERSDSDRDVSSLYEQAVEYAPSYEFFWKYLQLPETDYTAKMDLCRRLRQYLCSPRCRDDVDEQSHHLLEIVLYQAALCTMSGRFKDGLQVIQAIVQSKASVIWLKLTPCDRVILWLSFIHLYECRQLPRSLFDPADSNPGPIVCEKPFVVPFRIGAKTRISYQTLLQLFQSSFSACGKDVKHEAATDDVFLSWLGALYRSRVLLEVSCQGWKAGQQLCEEILNCHPNLVDVWMCMMQLTNTSEDRRNGTEPLGTLEKDPGTGLKVSQAVAKGAGTSAEDSGSNVTTVDKEAVAKDSATVPEDTVSLGSSIRSTILEDLETVANDLSTSVGIITGTVDRALASNPQSVPIYLAGIFALIQCREIDSALNLAERCPISLYEVDDLHPATVDPNLLYCCLLGQPVPLKYQPPALRSSVSPKYISNQQANLWICYCLLLDLQGAHDQAAETYRLAISCLRRTEEVGRVWLAFLRRSAAAVMSEQSPWLSSPLSVDERRRRCRQFAMDIDTALTSLPVRRILPCSDRGTSDDYIRCARKSTSLASSITVADYSYHNEIVRLYIRCLSDISMIQGVYQKYIHRMPGNVELALEAVDYTLEHNSAAVGCGISLAVLRCCPRSVPLWFRCFRLSQAAGVDVTRGLYSAATAALPHSASVWKANVMFELLNKSRSNLKEAIEKCHRLGINLHGFIDGLLK